MTGHLVPHFGGSIISGKKSATLSNISGRYEVLAVFILIELKLKTILTFTQFYGNGRHTLH